ncbi:MAG TPA: hypothetical protein EYQ31_15270 [Candidatus Handelsmanbacteria bacterium]|nr:hypothetical protein [Candidatus Handelsmanbacteria bacterium]
MTPDDVRALRNHLAEIDAKIKAFTDIDREVGEMAELLLEMNLAKRDMATVYDTLASRLGDYMDSNQIVALRDGAQIERKMASNRSGWRHKDLAADVADRISQSSIDMETGEMVLTPREMMVQFLDYLQPSYWRVGELNKIGLNPDNYCNSSEPKISVIVRRGDAR